LRQDFPCLFRPLSLERTKAGDGVKAPALRPWRANICGILLAAGASKRFGSDKLMHPLAGQTPVALAALANLRAGDSARPSPWCVRRKHVGETG